MLLFWRSLVCFFRIDGIVIDDASICSVASSDEMAANRSFEVARARHLQDTQEKRARQTN
jgi:hypothetical protein